MNYLEEKVLKEALVLDESILKVSHFINQQIDPAVLDFAGSAFYDYFKNRGITKVLTIEASGIAYATVCALRLNVPLVFAKKGSSKLSGDDYSSEVFSFTKKQSWVVWVAKRLLSSDDVVLVIDDFLADGNAILGLLDIIKQAGANCEGAGIVIEKSFQNGHQLLIEQGIDLYSLVKVKSLAGNVVQL